MIFSEFKISGRCILCLLINFGVFRQKHSLNQIAQDSTVGLIMKAKDSGIKISEVYVDTVGMPEKYQVS